VTEQLPEVQPEPTPGPFFRFTDEASWLTAARTAGFMQTVTDDEGVESEVLKNYTQHYAIDVIGTITEGGEWDPETGEVLVEPTVLDGWHVNYLGPLPDGWEQYAVWPENPIRVFLGL
jgi:hypothetical protein